jgi:glycine/D-amino acid oxidase-like deaminating enzyme
MTRIVVVGAGIIGTAIAYHAARAGATVTLVDRGPIAEMGASRWGFGGVSWASACSPATIAFSDRGFARYLEMDAELGEPCGFRPGEFLALLRDTDEVAEAEQSVVAFRQRGHSARIIAVDELCRLEPALRFDGWAGALGIAQGHLDLRRCARAWARHAAARGAAVLEGVEVFALDDRAPIVRTSAGTLAADLVFLAAGAWTRPLLRGLGIDLPVFHSHAEFLYTDPAPPVLAHQIAYGNARRAQAEEAAVDPAFADAWRAGEDRELVQHSQEFGLVQFADGHVRIGQTSRMIPAYREEPRPETFALLLDAARALFPQVDALPNIRLATRQVAFTPDHLPIVGPLPARPDIVLVATSTSPTVMAPAIGEAMAAYAVAGRWDPLLDEWSLDRPTVQRVAAWLLSKATGTGEFV